MNTLVILIFIFCAPFLHAIELVEEKAYYKEIDMPLEGLMEEAQNFISGESYGTLFRGGNDHLLKTFSAIPKFYRGCLAYINQNSKMIDFEQDTTTEFRSNILLCIVTMIQEMDEYSRAMLTDDKLQKIEKMSNPQLGYEGTLRILKKFLGFAQRSSLVMDKIYKHESGVLKELGQDPAEFDVFKQLKQVCKNFKVAISIYDAKLQAQSADAGALIPQLTDGNPPEVSHRRKSLGGFKKTLTSPRVLAIKEQDNIIPTLDTLSCSSSQPDILGPRSVSLPFAVTKKFSATDGTLSKLPKKKLLKKELPPKEDD